MKVEQVHTSTYFRSMVAHAHIIDDINYLRFIIVFIKMLSTFMNNNFRAARLFKTEK